MSFTDDETVYGRVDEVVSELGLPQRVFESSCRVCDRVRMLDNISKFLNGTGNGVEALTGVCVYRGGRSEDVPVTWDDVESVVGVDKSVLRSLYRNVARGMGWSPLLLKAPVFVDYYFDDVEVPVSQSGVAEVFGTSESSVRRMYKELLKEFTGLSSVSGKPLKDLSVTGESFGFFGDDVESFALFLAEKSVDKGFSRRPQAVGAACVYVAWNVLEG